MEPEASPPPAETAAPASGFELPTARQVVGRGLQLALDGNRDIRNVSLYVGLLVLAVAGPAALLVVADLPRLLDVPWQLPQTLTPGELDELLSVLGPLYIVGALALLGVVTVSIDGQLMAASILAGRASGRPLSMRESLGRARQVFWRYGFAAFAVGVLSTAISSIVGIALGTYQNGDTVSGLLGTLVATLAVAPFGYILTAIVIGDVDGAAALRRSVTLARARPRLALVVAAFTFLASSLQVLGLGVAFDVVGEIATFLHPDLDPTAGGGLLVTIAFVAVALVAFGSLGLTVGAVTAAPQISAFLGLTHYSAGLDRARSAIAAPLDAASPDPAAPDPATPDPSPSQWAAPPRRSSPVRWVTIPMALLIGLEAVVVLGALGSSG